MILTCPACTARLVIPPSAEELRGVEVTHPACGHAFAPFAPHAAVVAKIATDEESLPFEIDTRTLRKALTQATTTPFRNIFPKFAAAGFAAAAAAEVVFLLDKGVDGALPAAHYTLALLGMGR